MQGICKGTPPSSRSGHTAAAWGEWLVIFGGWDGDQHLKNTHLLHAERMEWLHPETMSGIEDTPKARSGHTCCCVAGQLYLFAVRVSNPKPLTLNPKP